MKKKIFSVLFALVLALSLSLLPAVPAAAANLTVDTSLPDTPPNYTTIQAAITAAGDGDTIIVADGIYEESIWVTTDNLTLKSENGKDSTTIQNVGNAPSGETAGIDIDADGFTLGGEAGHGFTIVGGTAGFLIQLTHGESGVEISYNKIDTTGIASQGISVGAAGATGLTVSNNIFIADEGDVFQDVPISLNGPVTNLTVTYNMITGSGIPEKYGGAIDIDKALSGGIITNNTISGFDKGIITGSAGETRENLLISHNDISGCGWGILFRGTGVDMNTVTVNENNIHDNTLYGIENTTTAGTLDAENNWWGAATGPTIAGNPLGSGDAVSADVDYSPWWGASYLTGTAPSIVLVAHPWTWYTNGTIQDVIDIATAGDTINVAAGDYAENLVIDKALTLKSVAGKATTIIDASGTAVSEQRGAIQIAATVCDVTIGGAGTGFTIKAPNSGLQYGVEIGLNCDRATIEDNTISGTVQVGVHIWGAGDDAHEDIVIKDNTITTTASTPTGECYGIITAPIDQALNLFGAASLIDGNTIHGFYGCGMYLDGLDGTSDIVISNNTLYGNTRHGLVVVGREVSVTGNTIYSNRLNGLAIAGAIATTNITVEENSIYSNAEWGIRIYWGTATAITVNHNAIYNNITGGLSNGGTGTCPAQYNWWGSASGPTISTNPYNGQSTGNAVSSNVDYISWLIHTELASGWNIYSTPIACGTLTDTITKALDLWTADSSKVTAVYYFNGSSQSFAIATASLTLTPMVPVYLDMNAAATIDVISSTSNIAPPSQTAYAGWNLIGLAELYSMAAEDALASAYYVAGANNIGYSQVVSPGLGQAAWSAMRGAAIDTASSKTMAPCEGYWMNMVNQGILAGFTSTPITELLP